MYKNIEHSNVLKLSEQINYQKNQVTSKTIAQNSHVSITLFSFDKDEEIIDIEKHLSLDTKLLFTNVTNAYNLMNYYNKHNMKLEEQVKLANYIMTNAPELKLYALEASNILLSINV